MVNDDGRQKNISKTNKKYEMKRYFMLSEDKYFPIIWKIGIACLKVKICIEKAIILMRFCLVNSKIIIMFKIDVIVDGVAFNL